MTRMDPVQYRATFEIALLCAQRVECDAVQALFDDFYEDDYICDNGDIDANAYTTGRICNHNVVLAFMPGVGKANAAAVSASLRPSFPRVKLALVVGVCGGVPFKNVVEQKDEVLLGDIVISTGLIQIDFGRRYPDTMVRKDNLSDNLGRPNTEIRGFLAKLSTLRSRKKLLQNTHSYLAELLDTEDFENACYPGKDKDRLYDSEYRHMHRDPTLRQVCGQCDPHNDNVCDFASRASCAHLKCEESKLIPRTRLTNAKTKTLSPLIHFGLVGSGDIDITSGLHRDRVASAEKIIAFEKEGAGVWDNLPTVVIKSVANYADNHRIYHWDDYAAASAASCMKAFLSEWKAGGDKKREIQAASNSPEDSEASALVVTKPTNKQEATGEVLLQIRDIMISLSQLPPRPIDTNGQISSPKLHQIMGSLSGSNKSSPTTSDIYIQQAYLKLPRSYAQEGGKFWLHPRFLRWEKQTNPSLILVKGHFKIRQEVKAFSIDIIQMLRKHKVCVAWVLKDVAQEASSSLSVIDVLKEITRQVIELNGSGHNEKSMSSRCQQYRSAETEEQWFELLASSIVGIAQLYIVIDIEAVGVTSVRGKSSSAWILPFHRMMDKLTSNGSNTRLKILLISYGSAAVHEPNLSDFKNRVVFVRQSPQTARIRGKRSRLPVQSRRLGKVSD